MRKSNGLKIIILVILSIRLIWAFSDETGAKVSNNNQQGKTSTNIDCTRLKVWRRTLTLV